jgi:tetratricopeptide (TPR) repeat protein
MKLRKLTCHSHNPQARLSPRRRVGRVSRVTRPALRVARNFSSSFGVGVICFPPPPYRTRERDARAAPPFTSICVSFATEEPDMALVYISSTFSDLKEYRKAVYAALRRMGHDVISMEDYNASSRLPLDVCLRDVARCELYVGIFAWRYGFVPDAADPARPEEGNPERKSITALEYLHARGNGKDCLIFLLDPDAPWPVSQMEEGEGAKQIRALRAQFGNNHIVDFFTDVKDLTTKVSTAVASWREGRRQASHVARTEGRPGAPEVNIARLPVTGTQLFGRDEHLKRLDEAWDKRDTHVLSFVAWGGVGKSALVNHWLAGVARDDYRGAERVYGWSFYSQGTTDRAVSADQFIEAALVFFGDTEPNRGSPWEKGERLARLVGGKRTLLLLDGLEPLQYPPGPDEGRLKEQSMQALLRGLAAHNEGLCVISTRVPVTDLADYEGNTVTRIDLETLSDEAGAQVLTAQGAKGAPEELKQASREFGGHSLALTLLGSYLSDVYGGDITRRNEVRGLEDDERLGRHAQRVMTSYERWFGEGRELSVLRMLGLFNRPADKGSIDSLRAAPAIPGLTDALQGMDELSWQRTLSKLRRAKLLAERDDAHPDTLDAHPLVREHFELQLKRTNPDAWREGNSRLYEHLRDTTKEFPDTIEEITPLFTAVAHGCAAGRYKEVFGSVFMRRINRMSDYGVSKLGAYSATLAALTGFFDPPWQQLVPILDESEKAFILNGVGYTLQALGRLVEAEQPMVAALNTCILRKSWTTAAVAASNLSVLHLTLGNLRLALTYGQQSVDLADKGGDVFNQLDHRTVLADALSKAGQFLEAETYFRDALERQKRYQSQFPLLYSMAGFRYCMLLLHQGKYQEVQSCAAQTLELAKLYLPLLEIALDYLSLGHAYLLQSQHKAIGDYLRATDYLNRAVDGLRHAGSLDELPRGLLARSELHRVKGEFDRARVDLDEAMSIATRGSMGLHQADCHLEYARLYLAEEQKDAGKAREHLVKAREMIGRMGYHLRDEAVRELEARLGEAGG